MSAPALVPPAVAGPRGEVRSWRPSGHDAVAGWPVTIRTLGGFGVIRDGVALGASAWQSRKARDLVKVLVARRGRAIARDQLAEVLWAEEDPTALSNRLSVALSVARRLLDVGRGDPLIADVDCVALDLSVVTVDVERFLTDARRGLGLHREQHPDALSVLEDAEAAYTGDFLEEAPYADWAVALREEARAAAIAVSRSLAEAAADRCDPDATVRSLLRILAWDPYDEGAHLALVSGLLGARRHGEARRCYGIYRSRMDEIEVPAAPFPSASASV